MSLILRSTKGSKLSISEMDGNFTYLQSLAISGGTSGTTTNPGGSNSQVQFNDDGKFGGSSNMTFDKSTGGLSIKQVYSNGGVISSFFSNGQTISSNQAIPENQNAFIVGPEITIEDGYEMVVGNGSNLTLTDFSVSANTECCFTGNTSANCIDNLWVKNLRACNDSINVFGGVNVSDSMSATTFYGDGSNLTNVNLGTGATNFWSLNGNAAGPSSFFGTTNNTKLLFKKGTNQAALLGDGLTNAFFGIEAGESVISGQGNTGIGDRSLKAATIGNSNTAVGVDSLLLLTDGSQNVSIGYHNMLSTTTGDDNVSVGHDAMYNNVSGNGNTTLGRRTLSANQSGSYNTAIGYDALFSSTGSRNVAIGRGAGSLGDYSDRLFIDNQPRGNSANELTKSLIVGTFDPDPSNQNLTINSTLNLPYIGNSALTQVLTYNYFTGQVFYSDINNLLVSGSSGSSGTSGTSGSSGQNFTGNTSASCITQIWIQNINGCSGQVNVLGNLITYGSLSATTFYGDGSNLTGISGGTSGSSGTSGTSGLSGATGSSGTSGTSGVSPDAGYSVYRALISQTSTDDPIVTVLGENTIGPIVWTRVGPGHYYASRSGSFSVNKTWYYIAQTKTSYDSDNSPIFTMNVVDSNTIEILTYIGAPLTGLQDGLLNRVPIEIKIFL